ncbi:MAG: VOC family protein [Chloroflexota bacterium]|nr:VOC family protein [Chloroflexota bacterium]
MFKRADHVAMSVKDMEKAIAFYHDVIGMEKVFDRTFGEEMGRLIGVEGTQVRIVHMKLDDSVIELFDYASPKGREPLREPTQSDYGLTHIGFIVEDFWDTYENLKDHGVEFLGEAVEIRPGVFVAYFHGVEYEVCEIREILPPSQGSEYDTEN